VVSVGSSISPVIQKNPHFVSHFIVGGKLDFLQFKKAITHFLNTSTPDIIHFFDSESLNLALIANSLTDYPVVLTKCGGPNPIRRKWQQVDHLILFSKENFDWFSRNPLYDKERLHLIPNRVSPIRISQRYPDYKKDERKINFVRITRLGGAYEKTLLDTFTLIEKLQKNHPVHLYVIGRIQNPHRFEELRLVAKNKKISVTFITDERTSKASTFLYLADFVVGTGRSLMEAMSLGIPCLTPESNSTEPVLITRANFMDLFRTNFSERNKLPASSIQASQKTLKDALEDSSVYTSLSREMNSLFSEYFSIDKVHEAYGKIYESATINRRGFSLRRTNFSYLIKQLLK
jgi:glycosyltransferase involved in cell wall biosynthesis